MFLQGDRTILVQYCNDRLDRGQPMRLSSQFAQCEIQFSLVGRLARKVMHFRPLVAAGAAFSSVLIQKAAGRRLEHHLKRTRDLERISVTKLGW